MMKRSGVPRMGSEDPAPLPQQNAPQMQPQQQPGVSNMHTLAQSAQPQILSNTTMLSVGSSFGRGSRAPPPVLNYLKSGTVQYAAPKQPPPQPPRLKQPSLPPAPPLGGQSPGAAASAPPPQFQRLKVEDALSYLDQVKYKFNTQPQVYNDFLDIMKEFKSQTIDTPGVITRVSNLFKGHPELIVGFNTFLPPGYKIEVQSNGQVSVSMPSPTGLGVGVHLHHAAAQPQLLHLLPVAQSVGNAIVHKLQVSSPAALLPRSDPPATHHAPKPFEPAAAQPPSTVVSIPGQPPPAQQQPVEFNHAIEYVNKIKSRFSRQPDKYKRFLEILHAYQRGHRDLKEPSVKQHTEQQVYSQVAKLFENQEDLLAEFGQFLPDAKTATKPSPQRSPPPSHAQMSSVIAQAHIEQEQERFANIQPEPPVVHVNPVPAAPKPAAAPAPAHHLKRSPSFSSSHMASQAPPPKKSRLSSALTGATVRDVSYAEAAKLATIHDYNFFDRVRKALRSQHVYDNFLRCLLLYTNEIISASELVSVTQPFLARQPELQRALRRLLLVNDPPNIISYGFAGSNVSATNSSARRYEGVGQLAAQLRHDRPPPEIALDIDLNTCKRLGASYVALPREAANRKCSGRTPLCKEVLNDTWVSFPSWSEDSTFVTSRKTQYEEYIYRCEDERFELDVVIETNASTIRVLEGVQKKLSRMSSEEAAAYRLDDTLGGHSPTIHQRALRRIYGDKVAVDIIAGLKKNPAVAVPVVLRRLKAKEEEWRDAQKGFNKQWRELNEKYYLKSLDHQGINFKQNDLKAMRSKCLFNEVESAYAAGKPGPHLIVDYNTRSRQEAIKILTDAAELLIHHARRQTAIQKVEKRRIKQLLRQFLPDLFAHPRQPLSDDERDDDDKDERASPDSPGDAMNDDKSVISTTVKQEKNESSESDNASDKSSRHNKNDKENKPKNNNNTDALKVTENSIPKAEMKVEVEEARRGGGGGGGGEARFVCSVSWYMFLRVHAAICQRLCAAAAAAAAANNTTTTQTHNLPPSVTTATSPSEYYKTLLELVKGVLDGNVDPSTYEDAAREMFGIKAYPVYTLDKLVSIAVRQLQHVVSEPWSLLAAEMARGGMRGALSYVRRAHYYLSRDHTAFLVKLYGGAECRATFELLEGAAESRGEPHDANVQTRRARGEARGNKAVFLRRNVARSMGALGAGGGAPSNVARGRPPPPPPQHRRKPAAPPAAPPPPRSSCFARPRPRRPLPGTRSARFRAWLQSRRQ